MALLLLCQILFLHTLEFYIKCLRGNRDLKQGEYQGGDHEYQAECKTDIAKHTGFKELRHHRQGA